MAILDTLVVQLLMDSGGVVKGAKQAEEGLAKTGKEVEKTGKKLEGVGKKGADSFANFRREALGAIALFTGGASIAGFTHDIAAANTALGNLSRQLDIAPQKLTQLHEAMKASGGSAADVDGLFRSIQNKASTNEGLAQLTRLGQLTGVSFLDKNGRVRADIFDQFAHSKQFQGLSRGVQDNYIQQLGGSTAVTNLVDRKDYDALQKRFAGLGPSAEQIRQGEQLLSDWTELKANTDQVMQGVFSDLEPGIHNFLQALIALEKAHPKEIADGVATLASALMIISGLLTAKSFLGKLKKITALGGGGAAAGGPGLVGGAAMVGLFASSPVSPDDRKAIAQGQAYEDLVQHYKRRTGAYTVWGFDEDKERELVRKEKITSDRASPIAKNTTHVSPAPAEPRNREAVDTERHWSWLRNTLDWLKTALIPKAQAADEPQAAGVASVRAEWAAPPEIPAARMDAPEIPPVRMERPDMQGIASGIRWPSLPDMSVSAENIDLERLTGAVAMQESGGNANAVSPVGAQGLLQLMPSTARGLGVTNPFDADQSWAAGQKYLSHLLNRFHDLSKALAAYNWGPGNLDKDLRKHGDQWQAYLPRETADYLYKVGRNYQTGNVVHHNTTTHSPTISVTVNGGVGTPADIHHMARQGASEALAQHEAGKVG